MKNKNIKFPTKNIGFTETERNLALLCENTFLKLWSYTSLYNNEGIDKNKKGTEICDLLVFFDGKIIIFSDKEIKFNEEKMIFMEDDSSQTIAWKRWKKRAIDASIKQIKGAEKWILNHPDRIYFDEKCQEQFPFINSENIKNIKIYRVAIANGAPSGLYLGSEHTDFVINHHYIDDGYVHIFDGKTIKILLSELSSAKEFINYLEGKEKFFREDNIFNYVERVSELDLLATFLLSPSLERSNGFYCHNNTLHIEKYSDLIIAEDYLGGKDEDKISIIYDELLNAISSKIMNGDVLSNDLNSFIKNHKVISLMASFDRLERRVLAKTFMDKFIETKGKQISSRAIMDDSDSTTAGNKMDITFVMVIFPRAACKELSKEQYINTRDNIAKAYATRYSEALNKESDIIVIVFDNINELEVSWKTNYSSFIKKIYSKGFSVFYRDKNIELCQDEILNFEVMQKNWGILRNDRLRNYRTVEHQYIESK